MSVANKPGIFKVRFGGGNRQWRRHGWKKAGVIPMAGGVSWLMAGLLLPYMPANEDGAQV